MSNEVSEPRKKSAKSNKPAGMSPSEFNHQVQQAHLRNRQFVRKRYSADGKPWLVDKSG